MGSGRGFFGAQCGCAECHVCRRLCWMRRQNDPQGRLYSVHFFWPYRVFVGVAELETRVSDICRSRCSDRVDWGSVVLDFLEHTSRDASEQICELTVPWRSSNTQPGRPLRRE
jgi:hypothetical protein